MRHAVADLRIQGIVPEDIGDHPRPLVEQDRRDDIGNLVSVCRRRRPPDDREALDTAKPAGLHLIEISFPAGRAMMPGRKLKRPAGAAFLEKQASFPGRGPVFP
ncbi:MAG: hypothetical protein M9917_10075 [Bosea sp.]|nr:hypothetical protein [Bosea sp. (in: a-proteobacteria)]MCO5091349.1 hypothetical protein [Bosea sp. (in: a-proteobacteria)]